MTAAHLSPGCSGWTLPSRHTAVHAASDVETACFSFFRQAEPDSPSYNEVYACFSHLQLFATPQTIDCQAPLSMEFSRQEYWSGLPFSPPGYLHDPGTGPTSPAFQVDSLPLSCRNPSNNNICQTRSGGLSHRSLLPAITKASLLCCTKLAGRETKGKERASGEKQMKAENKNHVFPSFFGVRN